MPNQRLPKQTLPITSKGIVNFPDTTKNSPGDNANGDSIVEREESDKHPFRPSVVGILSWLLINGGIAGGGGGRIGVFDAASPFLPVGKINNNPVRTADIGSGKPTQDEHGNENERDGASSATVKIDIKLVVVGEPIEI